MGSKIQASPAPFIQHLTDAIVIVSKENETIVETNLAAQKLAAKSEDQLQNLPVSALLPNWDQHYSINHSICSTEGEKMKRIHLTVEDFGRNQEYWFCVLKPSESFEQPVEENLLTTLVNIVPDFIGIKDGKGRFLFANKFAGELFGFSHENVIGKSDFDLGNSLPQYKKMFETCFERDEDVWNGRELKRYHERIPLDNQERIFDVYKIPVFTKHGERKNLLIFGREITSQVASHKKLLESESRYRLLAENSTDMISTHDINGEMLYVSPACMSLLGYHQEELRAYKAFSLFHPDDVRRSLKLHNQLLKGKKVSSFSFRVRNAKGEYCWVESSCRGIVDPKSGNVVEIIAVTRDISQRMEAEEMVRKSDKLSIVGQLAASVAHEIRNPLTALKGFIQLFQTRGVIDHNQKYYEIMFEELNRIEQIITELLILAKPQSKTLETKDIKELIHYVIDLLSRQALVHNIHIVCDIKETLPAISCVENELKQVFINLVKNSIEAMPEGGVIHIAGSKHEDGIEIVIHDQGCGIPPESINKLGEPFYSTKEKGTGLGLMTSYKIIREHQGQISIDSTPGNGTTVRISLPTA
ncbi:PAS/PAC sensor signal transduction histidine kinase [Fictibacillus macauensis ZFHKF-1]|uniref:histidine kinase n=1 Tax=Fictibacillus macauensis ZFHKF-1 TaxID=1196324 RepID=I8UKZ6_9BACL|nr:PAS domain S-box protein [Fictibacillus macauensis]EIT87468.1 PAS/PAC sensor signal transduction histidine kinase [Fictibacillus macauensis ZFHKF-1]